MTILHKRSATGRPTHSVMLDESRGVSSTRRSLALRIAGCIAAIVSMLIGTFVVIAPAQAAAPGYLLSSSRIVGEAPGGFQVYLSPYAPHRGTMSPAISIITANLRSFGLPVAYKGYGHPAHVRGIITVSEGPGGCTGGSAVLANTYWSYGSLRGGGLYMYRSDIVICAARYARSPSWQRAAILRHEFGHAMGLAHLNSTYGGHYQVMAAYTHDYVSQYGAGDAAGLRHLAAGAARVRAGL